jgi:hypothetical protein
MSPAVKRTADVNFDRLEDNKIAKLKSNNAQRLTEQRRRHFNADTCTNTYAVLSTADIQQARWNVRYVPTAEVRRRDKASVHRPGGSPTWNPRAFGGCAGRMKCLIGYARLLMAPIALGKRSMEIIYWQAI